MRRLLLATVAMVAMTGAAHADALRLCTGGEAGNYYFAGVEIAKQGKGSVDVQPLTTLGSMQNIEMLTSGKCDGAIVQTDALTAYLRQHAGATLKVERATVLYDEIAHLLCNRKAGISKITKLTAKHNVAVGPLGAGSNVTWDGFIAADQATYKGVQTSPYANERAVAKVAEGTEVQCMLFTAGLNTPFLKEIATAYGDRVELVNTADSDMAKVKDPKGQPLYTYRDIPSDMYKGIQSGSVHAIAVQAILIVNADWVDAHEADFNKLLAATRKALPTIKQRVGQ